MKIYANVLKIIFFVLLMVCTFPNLAKNIPPSLVDHPYVSEPEDVTDGSWLPNIAGLPDQAQVDQFAQYILKLMLEEKDTKCGKIDSHIKKMVFQHFLMYQHVANSQNIYFDEEIAHKWAKVLSIILKESSGDSTSITDMKGHSVSTYSAHTNLQNWKNLFGSAVRDRINLGYQTNFGLTQLSADRLFVALNLAKKTGLNTTFLKGKENEDLNTAIAVRRLIWFYQYFAQGRISQSTMPISKEDISKPKFSNRYQDGLKMALMFCGTHFLFHEKDKTNEEKELSDLENTMAAIAYCKLGSSRSGYGRDEFDVKCFAAWVTFCPALNIKIALITPLKYFATRKATPVCKDMFKRMINKKPNIN